MIDQLLGGTSVLTAVSAIGIYFWLVFRRPRILRLFSSLGLFLTGLALFQGPALLAVADGSVNVRLAVAVLILAVIAQVSAALKSRPVWTGEDRRTEAGADGR
jgi:glucose dehydrogenase